MKYTELKEGEIYYCNWLGQNNRLIYIFRATKDCQHCSHLELNSKYFSIESGHFADIQHINREATQQEKEHFLQCEKTRKYIEYVPENHFLLINN